MILDLAEGKLDLREDDILLAVAQFGRLITYVVYVSGRLWRTSKVTGVEVIPLQQSKTVHIQQHLGIEQQRKCSNPGVTAGHINNFALWRL